MNMQTVTSLGVRAVILSWALLVALPVGATAEQRSNIAAVTEDTAKDVKNTAVGYTRQTQRAAEGATTPLTREERDEAVKDRIDRKEDRQSVGEYLDDSAVTAKVKTKFMEQKGLDSLDIKVITVDGDVTLMGDVDSANQVGMAESAAKTVDGVRKVTNRLVVKP